MANPSFESIRIAVESRLAAWGDAPVEYDGTSPPAYDEQNPSAPQNELPLVKAIWNKTPWVRCSILHGESRTVAVGQAPCVRRTGVLSFQVFTAKNQGSRSAAIISDSLAEHFEHYQSGQFETQSASVQRAPLDNDYDWYQYTVMIPFRMG